MSLAPKPSETTSLPAGLIESGIALIRAEIALALRHAQQLAVRAVTAAIATIVACAFAQLTVVLLVLSPMLVEVVAVENVVISIAASAFVMLAFGFGAAIAWLGVLRARNKKNPAGTPKLSPFEASTSGYDTQGQRERGTLAERASQ